MSSITKGLIGKADNALWDGKTGTYTRKTITGGVETLNKNDWVGVDALEVFGSGTTQTDATINAAIAAIGSSNAELFLANGTWTIANDITFPSTLTARTMGANLAIATGVTVTFAGGLIAPPDQQVITLTGTGAVVFGTQVVYPIWWGDADTKMGFYVSGTEQAYVDADGITMGSGNAFIGNLTGNVTGDVTGNVTGDLTGDVTGDLTNSTTGGLLVTILDVNDVIIHEFAVSLMPYINRYNNFFSGTDHDIYSEA